MLTLLLIAQTAVAETDPTDVILEPCASLVERAQLSPAPDATDVPIDAQFLFLPPEDCTGQVLGTLHDGVDLLEIEMLRNDRNTFAFKPDTPLAPDTQYTLTLDGASEPVAFTTGSSGAGPLGSGWVELAVDVEQSGFYLFYDGTLDIRYTDPQGLAAAYVYSGDRLLDAHLLGDEPVRLHPWWSTPIAGETCLRVELTDAAGALAETRDACATFDLVQKPVEEDPGCNSTGTTSGAWLVLLGLLGWRRTDPSCPDR